MQAKRRTLTLLLEESLVHGLYVLQLLLLQLQVNAQLVHCAKTAKRAWNRDKRRQNKHSAGKCVFSISCVHVLYLMRAPAEPAIARGIATLNRTIQLV